MVELESKRAPGRFVSSALCFEMRRYMYYSDIPIETSTKAAKISNIAITITEITNFFPKLFRLKATDRADHEIKPDTNIAAPKPASEPINPGHKCWKSIKSIPDNIVVLSATRKATTPASSVKKATIHPNIIVELIKPSKPIKLRPITESITFQKPPSCC